MDNNKNIRLVSGGFDPIHAGHIALLKAARKELSDHIHTIVALNSDDWLVRKKGTYFMPWEERAKILDNMEGVQEVMKFNDSDGTANDAIAKCKERWPGYTVHFYNGGDRSKGNIMEIMKYSDDPLVKFYFAAGGDIKENSSSDILKDWLNRHMDLTERNWGSYKVLGELTGAKIKFLDVAPGKSLSMQKHEHRSEHWFVAWGTATLEMHEGDLEDNRPNIMQLGRHSLITVPVGHWHKLSNNSNDKLYIVEIQYGEKCEESDIVVQLVDK